MSVLYRFILSPSACFPPYEYLPSLAMMSTYTGMGGIDSYKKPWMYYRKRKYKRCVFVDSGGHPCGAAGNV